MATATPTTEALVAHTVRTETTRRALLGVAGLATASLAIPAIANQNAPSTGHRSAWRRAVEVYRARQVAYTIASERHNDAEEAYMEDRPERPIFTMEIEGDYGIFGKHVLPVTIMHEDLDDLTRGWKDPEKIAAFRVRLAEFRSQDEAAKARHGVDAAAQAARLAGDAEIQAYDRLAEMPATDAHMLAEKIDLLAPEWSEDGPLWAALKVDAKRVALGKGMAA